MAPTTSFAHWRSPPPPDAPPLDMLASPQSKVGLLHPSFLPPCEHGKEGDMHAHAFDLLSLAGDHAPSTQVTPSSVPATSILTASRPALNVQAAVPNSSPAGGLPPTSAKARRMSSSTTGVLGRGKLGVTGDGKDARPTPVSSAAPIPGRRPSNAGASPQLFDFTKTDRRPSRAGSRPISSAVAASLPSRGFAGPGRIIHPPPQDDMELDMEFDDDVDDYDDGSAEGANSAELDLDPDDDGEIKPEWEKLALGTGSGGIKGRRKGMVFKCENCAKEYRHPSCLVKHRWEHSPHWREPTQISMSKHQQVQMLEAAAILAHLDPGNMAGRSLPTDKSLWPAILTPSGEAAAPRSARATPRDLPGGLRSPPSSTIAPLTPSSLREVSTFGALSERKSSPGSDSTSSLGAPSDSFAAGTSPNPNSLGLKPNGRDPSGHSRPLGINSHRRASAASSVAQPGTPHSIGSLPDMAGLHFHTGSAPTGTSPIPNRAGVSPIVGSGGGLPPLSLTARVGMIGGGMFGSAARSAQDRYVKVPDSSIRGQLAEDDEDEDDLQYALGGRARPSSSEEAEERRRDDEGGFEIDMDL